MSDLFEPLRQPEHVPTPRASDVRRRGDQIRRRRTTLQVVGAAAVVAIVAGGVGFLSTSDDTAPLPIAPSPTPSSTPSPVQSQVQIPADFPLAQGYPDRNEDGTPVIAGPDADVFTGDLCGSPVTTRQAPADVLGTSYTGIEDFRARKVLLFDDMRLARRGFSDLQDLYGQCASGDGFQQTTAGFSDGDESLLSLRTYVTDGQPSLGQETTILVRVGNAVLLASEYGEGPGATNLAAAYQAAAEVAERTRPVVAAMCAFSSNDCGGPETPPLPDVIGPDGAGALKLGMSEAAARATGLIPVLRPCVIERGVEAVFAQPGMRTPEGIGLGSTRQDVEEAYDDLTLDEIHLYLTTPAATGMRYQFGFGPSDTVAELNLALDDQQCFG